PNGNYSFRAIARDAAGNTRTSSVLTVTIQNSTTIPTPNPTVTPTSTPPSDGQALFSDDFEGYSVGREIRNGGGGGFTWGGGNGYQPVVATEVANSGRQSIRFAFGPYEPNGNTHWWP